MTTQLQPSDAPAGSVLASASGTTTVRDMPPMEVLAGPFDQGPGLPPRFAPGTSPVTERFLWGVSLAMSIGFLLIVVFVWWDIHSRNPLPEKGFPVRSGDEVSRYLASAAPGSFRVPTGVFIQSKEFLTGDNVRVSGFVWQKYDKDIPASVTRGIVLPEADHAYLEQPVYRHVTDDNELIGWSFSVVFRERFDYRRYPLDRQDLWIRMSHPDLDRNVVLVPDFGSYPPWRDAGVIGVDRDIANTAWRPESSFFSFVRHPYSTSFGLPKSNWRTYDKSEGRPELYFNLDMARSFAGPMVDNLIPLGFVAMLVFAALLVTVRSAKAKARFGFSTFGVITFSGSMLLVVAVHHSSLRQSIGASGTVYLEYFLYTLYCAILLVAFNSAAVVSGHAPRILRWRSNLLPRIAYWPLIFGTLALTSLLVLY